MPQIWPNIKKAVVYPVFPQLEPEPAATAEPYVPESNTDYGAPISASDSLVYYFYKDYCGYCREISPLINGLPDKILLSDGTKSKVRLVALNKVKEEYHDIINKFYEDHDIPEDRRYVPAIVIGDRYLHLKAEITDQLLNVLINGEGLNTPMLDGSERIKNNT